MSELSAVIGREKQDHTDIASCFSELVFRINDIGFRLPYTNDKITISENTKSVLISAALRHYKTIMSSYK
jgi:hypothetical protein